MSTGYERKRRYDERQRALGRKPCQFWITKDENIAIKNFLREYRSIIRKFNDIEREDCHQEIFGRTEKV